MLVHYFTLKTELMTGFEPAPHPTKDVYQLSHTAIVGFISQAIAFCFKEDI